MYNTEFKNKTCLIELFYRHCFGTAIFLKIVNFIVSASCKNENKLKLTFHFLLDKANFN